MGAYGAALCAMRLERSGLLGSAELKEFVHTAKSAICQGCANHCHLTINQFSGGRPVYLRQSVPEGPGHPGRGGAAEYLRLEAGLFYHAAAPAR